MFYDVLLVWTGSYAPNDSCRGPEYKVIIKSGTQNSRLTLCFWSKPVSWPHLYIAWNATVTNVSIRTLLLNFVPVTQR